jgi:hypothetical protein
VGLEEDIGGALVGARVGPRWVYVGLGGLRG